VIAPLSLCNVLTVAVAILCLWTTGTQSLGGAVRIWRLAVPPSLAAVDALILLAGVFDATIAHDVEWIACALLGAVVGRARGWMAPVESDGKWGFIRLPRMIDGLLAGLGLVVLALADSAGAALEEPVIEPHHVAAGAAFCAGFLAFRALALSTRAVRASHAHAPDVDQPS
jgi:hypothetical protein